jgi:uncharacterized protein (UPF0332 family)
LNPEEFLELADEWASGSRQGEWRSAASRAYYAVFHVARSILRGAGFTVPDSDRAHGFLWLRLSNAGQPDVIDAAGRLHDLRRWRNEADYDFDRPFPESLGVEAVDLALGAIRLLRDLQNEPAVLARVVGAIRAYERLVGEETWHSP